MHYNTQPVNDWRKSSTYIHCNEHFSVTSPTLAAIFCGNSETLEVRSLKFVGNSGKKMKRSKNHHIRRHTRAFCYLFFFFQCFCKVSKFIFTSQPFNSLQVIEYKQETQKHFQQIIYAYTQKTHTHAYNNTNTYTHIQQFIDIYI